MSILGAVRHPSVPLLHCLTNKAMQMEPNLILLNVATKNSSWPAALWLAAEAPVLMSSCPSQVYAVMSWRCRLDSCIPTGRGNHEQMCLLMRPIGLEPSLL